ncbi:MULTISPECIES: sodium-dependent transporter [unclassified Paenibacillus]|uniref:sodium-dependent transporter n=1 Tax=unclassified Paenibacillus TaxID=185978 RepID=UPI0004F7B7AA|nr:MULTISPECIES: sodium-dependent transporter [unclassified Paenibacillus]AIQ45853.1 Na+-dependent transporter of the SNF family protein [Paenibacillus sp. FSL R7-0273]AIQ51491.1 Na+-dependent transporter of the SNF family protein [Paenibacillus sp. FSL R7-0331]OMF95385.1 sodium-dependent transporter [Paenibacillus sp. FSL R7-0273]
MNQQKGQQSLLTEKKERFSNSGFIFAAIGSSVGLGNMWKFPYITGENGGAAFFLLFIVCLVLIGLPVLLAELAIGRSGRGSAASSFIRAGGGKGWKVAGILQVIAPFLILSFYVIVAGWTLQYAVISFNGQLFSTTDYAGEFGSFVSGYMPIVWQGIAMLITAAVVILGVSGGIEKFNKVLIPGLVVLLIVLMIRAVTLPGSSAGVSFFLKPDFSVLTAESALVALGHAFFSLSLGMGILLTYGSYVDKNQSLGSATLAIGAGDLLYAFIAGLIIFPTTFSFGIAPDQGPSLIFVALPAAFSAMPFGAFFGGLFFILLAIAALTSAVSLLEVPVSYAMERFRWSRPRAVWILSLVCFLVGVPSAMSLGMFPELTFGGKALFDWMDFITSNIMLPLGGLLITLFAGYFWKGAADAAGLNARWFRIWLFTLRYVAPVLVFLVLLHTSGIIKF